MADFDETLNHILGNPDAMAQIMQLAQSLSGNETQNAPSPPPPPEPAAPSANTDLLSSLTGAFDPQLLMRILPVLQEFSREENAHARQLLYALRPYLKKERQDNVDRALQLAKLFHLGKKFLSSWEV